MPQLLVHGECRSVLEELAPECVDSLVTDPPSGIEFMNMEWDSDHGGRDAWVRWLAEIMGECLRVLKPGSHGLVWALPRTSHWTAWACEDAGFEVRDRVSHIFGTGFPKSYNGKWGGTALKPAVEDWWLVRKPLQGTLRKNWAEFGTGALNIKACRVGPRWPAHLVLDEAAALQLDEQSGWLKSGKVKGGTARKSRRGVAYESPLSARTGGETYGDAGGASRFFYVAKPTRKERDAGCEHLPKRSGGEATSRKDGSAGLKNPRAGAGRNGGARNVHPTVKGIALMRWLCRLVTPDGGMILDPFTGSGTTGLAAAIEGFGFMGIEQKAEYVKIAHARSSAVQTQREVTNG